MEFRGGRGGLYRSSVKVYLKSVYSVYVPLLLKSDDGLSESVGFVDRVSTLALFNKFDLICCAV